MTTLTLILIFQTIIISALIVGIIALWKVSKQIRFPNESAMRNEAEERAKRLREEIGNRIQEFGGSLQNLLKDTSETTIKRVNEISESNERRQGELRKTVEEQLEKLRDDNSKKLTEMQKTVDEKLEGTLQKRLGESFKLVSERLEQVHQGLGEMQSLAAGVGDLKRTLMNVKTRGTWAEVQLGSLLEEIMSPEQYLKNASINPNSREVVEYAIRLPGQDADEEVLLPIDAKFPQEDFERLMDAIDNANKELIESARKSLENRIRDEAKRISTKYVQPPKTTNFAILFLPTEGLYAEVIRMPGIASEIQRSHGITIAGPTTLSALLNSLRAGFHTLAIQKRTGEVWNILTEATEEFKKYGDTWETVRKQLATVTNTVEKVGTRTRAVERKLRNIGSFKAGESPVSGLISNAADDVGNSDDGIRDHD